MMSAYLFTFLFILSKDSIACGSSRKPKDHDVCERVSCNNNGTCVELSENEQYKCNCNDGYKGKHCETEDHTGFVKVTVPHRIVGNVGDTVRLPCSFTLEKESDWELIWYYLLPKGINKKLYDLYKYRKGVEDTVIAKAPGYQRTHRDNVSLIVSNFKELDARYRKCCQVTSVKPWASAIKCIDIDFINFPKAALECFDANDDTIISNNSRIDVRDVRTSRFNGRCEYRNVHPPCDLEVWYQQPQGLKRIATAYRKDAIETDWNHYSLSIDFDKYISSTTTFVIKAIGDDDVLRMFTFTLNQPDSSGEEGATYSPNYENDVDDDGSNVLAAEHGKKPVEESVHIPLRTLLVYGGIGGGALFLVVSLFIIVNCVIRTGPKSNNDGKKKQTDSTQDLTDNQRKNFVIIIKQDD